MSVSQIKVCNLALVRVGADTVSSITQSTKSAIILNAIYEQCRDEVLRMHPWHFAVKRAALAPTSDAPVFEYDYAYDLPADCLRPLDLDSLDIDFVVENKQILTNENTILNTRYIFRNDDENSWDPVFGSALAWKLSSEVSYALTQSLALTDSCQKQFARVLQEARTMNGFEGVPKDLEASEWTSARR